MPDSTPGVLLEAMYRERVQKLERANRSLEESFSSVYRDLEELQQAVEQEAASNGLGDCEAPLEACHSLGLFARQYYEGWSLENAENARLRAEIERLQAIDPGILEQLASGTQAGPGWAPDDIDPDDLIGWAQ